MTTRAMDPRDRRRGFAARKGGRAVGLAVAGAMAGALGACAHFTAAPLPQGPDLATSASQLSVDVSRVRLAPLPPRRIDPAKGVDPIDVAILAVLNSPDLAAKRAAAHVAAAQTFSAGLLPDPTVPLSTDIPDKMAGFYTAFAVTPTIDISALITRSATLRAARASESQANLDVLWSEWSTAQQARQYAVTVLTNDEKAEVLARLDAELSERARQSGIALTRHDVTGPVASADLAAKLDADVQLAAARVAADKARHQLNALIGLAPDARLPLVDSQGPHDPEPAAVQSALAALPKRRPDLLALQAGYESQNGVLRKSILAQFPLLNVGYSRQRDTGNIYTNGAAATVTLPIFNRNRGDIAIQRATRERLAQEYRARLDQTVADVAQAQVDLANQQAALGQFETEVPRLEAEADLGRPAFARRDLDSAAYLAIEQAVIKEVVAMWDTRLARRLADIGLETMLFLPPAEAGRP